MGLSNKGYRGYNKLLKLKTLPTQRLSRIISQDRMKRIADSLYTSKIKYGIQLFGKVRLSESEPTESLLESLQITQNKFANFFLLPVFALK